MAVASDMVAFGCLFGIARRYAVGHGEWPAMAAPLGYELYRGRNPEKVTRPLHDKRDVKKIQGLKPMADTIARY